MPSLSVCIIAKDEAAMLAGCLRSLAPLNAEIIVVDTGSSDGTQELAKRLGAKVFSFGWQNDFSAARNVSLEKAAGDWILVIDADELLEPADAQGILRLVQMDFDAFSLLQRTYTDDASNLGFVPGKRYGFAGYFDVELVRLIRNGKGFHFSGRVHELLDDSLTGARIGRSDVVLHHLEHMKGPEVVKRKQLAYLSLLREERKERPDDLKLLCDIALLEFRYENNAQGARGILKRAIEAHPQSSRPRMLLGQLLAAEGRQGEAIAAYQGALTCKDAPLEIIERNLAALHAHD